MKKLILHIGSEKTGTTALQEILTKNEDLLRAVGVLYPSSGRIHNGHFGLVDEINATVTGQHFEFLHQSSWCGPGVWEELQEEISSFTGETVIISSEHLSSRLNVTGIELMVSKLCEIADWEFNVLFYARRQDQLLQSAYSETLRNGGTQNVDQLVESALKHCRYFDYGLILEDWASVLSVGSVMLRPFDNELQRVGLTSDFFQSIIGFVPDGMVYPTVQKNQSLHPITCIVAQELNQLLETKSHNCKQRTIWVLDELIKTDKAYSCQDDCSLLSHRARIEILSEYESSNAKLFDKYSAPRYFSDPMPADDAIDASSTMDVNTIVLELLCKLLQFHTEPVVDSSACKESDEINA